MSLRVPLLHLPNLQWSRRQENDVLYLDVVCEFLEVYLRDVSARNIRYLFHREEGT